MSHQQSIRMTRKGDLIDLDMESGLFGTLHLDNGAVPAEERPGTAKKLLAASALYCYCAALDKALDKAEAVKGVPTVIIAHTVKGKGVSFMEGKSAWHGKAIDDESFAKAMQELGGAV